MAFKEAENSVISINEEEAKDDLNYNPEDEEYFDDDESGELKLENLARIFVFIIGILLIYLFLCPKTNVFGIDLHSQESFSFIPQNDLPFNEHSKLLEESDAYEDSVQEELDNDLEEEEGDEEISQEYEFPDLNDETREEKQEQGTDASSKTLQDSNRA
jgi:hypothetical protein